MSGNDMPSKLVTEPESALEIDARAHAPAADGADAQRLSGGIHGEPVIAARDRREAGAIERNGGTDGD